MQILIIIALIFALAISIFAVQNSTPVDIRFLTWSQANISLVTVILGSFSAGAILAVLVNMIKNLQNQMKIKDLNHKLQSMTTEKKRLEEQYNKILSESGKKSFHDSV